MIPRSASTTKPVACADVFHSVSKARAASIWIATTPVEMRSSVRVQRDDSSSSMGCGSGMTGICGCTSGGSCTGDCGDCGCCGWGCGPGAGCSGGGGGGGSGCAWGPCCALAIVAASISVAAAIAIRRPLPSVHAVAESLMKTVPELVQRESVVLRADGRDLDRAEERRDAPGRFPVDAAQEAVHEAGAISVAAAGRVDHRRRTDRG